MKRLYLNEYSCFADVEREKVLWGKKIFILLPKLLFLEVPFTLDFISADTAPLFFFMDPLKRLAMLSCASPLQWIGTATPYFHAFAELPLISMSFAQGSCPVGCDTYVIPGGKNNQMYTLMSEYFRHYFNLHIQAETHCHQMQDIQQENGYQNGIFIPSVNHFHVLAKTVLRRVKFHFYHHKQKVCFWCG